MIEQVKLRAMETAQSFMLDMWLARHTSVTVLPILQRVLEGVKEEFADAIANGGGVYAVGYCFGGKYVLLLGSELPDSVAWGQGVKDEEKGIVKPGPAIKAGAIAHGNLHSESSISQFDILISARNAHHETRYRSGQITNKHGLYR